MLTIKETNTDTYISSLQNIQKNIATQMQNSETNYYYKSVDILNFELNMREKIINNSKNLNNSKFSFAIFRKVRVNEDFWIKTKNGGMKSKEDISTYDAIRDILENSSKYATECATAMIIVYYLALTEIYTKDKFDELFSGITLMNWHYIHPLLREVGQINRRNDYFLGDRRYFDNPDVNPQTPYWQGENVIMIDDNLFYGHGIGMKNSEAIIKHLNNNRIKNSEVSAFLMDNCGRPDFEKLYKSQF